MVMLKSGPQDESRSDIHIYGTFVSDDVIYTQTNEYNIPICLRQTDLCHTFVSASMNNTLIRTHTQRERESVLFVHVRALFVDAWIAAWYATERQNKFRASDGGCSMSLIHVALQQLQSISFGTDPIKALFWFQTLSIFMSFQNSIWRGNKKNIWLQCGEAFMVMRNLCMHCICVRNGCFGTDSGAWIFAFPWT